MAVITLIFAEYLNRIFWNISSAEVSPDDIPQWAIKLTAIGAVVVVTIICVAARKLGSRAAVVFTTVKVGFIFDLYDLYLTSNIARLPSWCGSRLYC
jgi:hypothetical protein